MKCLPTPVCTHYIPHCWTVITSDKNNLSCFYNDITHPTPVCTHYIPCCWTVVTSDKSSLSCFCNDITHPTPVCLHYIPCANKGCSCLEFSVTGMTSEAILFHNHPRSLSFTHLHATPSPPPPNKHTCKFYDQRAAGSINNCAYTWFSTAAQSTSHPLPRHLSFSFPLPPPSHPHRHLTSK